MCADVVVVGGGPIGCWTAIQIKKRNPALDVQVYERYEEYQRDHMLSIRKESLQRYTSRKKDDLENELYREIAKANNRERAPDANGENLMQVNYLRTLDFESILKNHCAKLGIKFSYDKIESPQDAMTRHPECSYFVAADGAHSGMRNALLGGEENSIVRKNMLPSVDVKYEAEGQAQYLKEPTFDKMSMIVIETMGKAADLSPDARIVSQSGPSADDVITQKMRAFYRDTPGFSDLPRAEKSKLALQERQRLMAEIDSGEHLTFVKQKSAVALRFLIDQETYDALPEATFKKPVTIEEAGPLRVGIEQFLNLRKEHTGEHIIGGRESLKLTKINLSQYASKKFAVPVKTQDRKAGWFFVGDAAMGVPFYRSINAGLLLGSQLGALLAGNSLSMPFKAAAYNALRPVKLAREFTAVAAKLSGIKIYQKAIRPVMRGLASVGLGIVVVPALILLGAYMAINPKARAM